MRELMRSENKVMYPPVLRFNTAFTRQLCAEVLHLMTVDQRRAVEALCYTMEAIDGLFADGAALATALGGSLDHAARLKAATDLLANLTDVIAKINRLNEMFDAYLAGRYTEIVTKRYNASEYEEA